MKKKNYKRLTFQQTHNLFRSSYTQYKLIHKIYLSRLRMFLLTGTIAPQGASQEKIQERLRSYHNAISVLLQQSTSHIDIVFCDNSNYPNFPTKTMQDIAKSNEKQFEYLTFQGNTEKTINQGRGYGDQEIMEYALDNSFLAQKHTSFYKLTGRYILRNIDDIVRNTHTLSNVFMRMGPLDKRISSAFFKASKVFFDSYLRGCGSQVNDAAGKKHQLEGIYTGIIESHIKEVSNFPILPLFSGITGSGYNLHDTKARKLVKQMLFSLGIYNVV